MRRLVHYLDKPAIQEKSIGFAKFIADGYRLELNGKVLTGQVMDLQIFAADKQSRFTNREEIKSSFTQRWLFQSDQRQYVGDAVIDIQIRYPTINPEGEIRFSSVLPSNLPKDTVIANLFIGYDGDKQSVTRVTGQFSDPIVLNPSRLSAIKAFVAHGFDHILSGFDHVLFVLCLTIGAASLTGLLWRVTGFTLGHTVTLIAGFFGYVPKSAWIIPMVEIMIAASIIYVAVVAIQKAATRATFVITAIMGLLHGFGFSFLLSDLLGRDSLHLVTSLLSFNLGIELGQLFIVLLIFVTLLSLARINPSVKNYCTNAIAIGSMVIASWRVIERIPGLLEVI